MFKMSNTIDACRVLGTHRRLKARRPDRGEPCRPAAQPTPPAFFAIAGAPRASGQRKSAVLLTGTVGRPDNFRLAYQQPIAGQEWDAPRHRHDFEQIRWVLD